MGKVLSKTLFFQMLANRSGLTERTVRKVYEQMFLLIADELRFNGEFELPDICKISTQQRGGVDKKMFGGYSFVEAYMAIKFKVRSRLMNVVNGKDVEEEAKTSKRSGRISTFKLRHRNLTDEEKWKDFEAYFDGLEQEAKDQGRKYTNKVSEEQLIRLISKYTGLSMASIRKMRESENNIIKYKLMNKQRIGYGSIGKFSLKYHKAIEEHDGKSKGRNGGEDIFIEAQDAYYTPRFTPLPAFKQEIRELTEGHLM